MVSTTSCSRPAVLKHERSPTEKSLVQRLDMFLMTFGCISQGQFHARVEITYNVTNINLGP